MPSGTSIEREIEDAIIARPELIGYPNALPIRNVRFDHGSGRVDVMLLPGPDCGPTRLVLIEVKRHDAVDAPDKVVGQLIKYYAHALKLGSDAIARFREYARDCPLSARGHEKTTPHKIYGGLRGSEVWPQLGKGKQLSPQEIDLFVALNGEGSPVLVQIVGVLSRFHSLPIGLIRVQGGFPGRANVPGHMG